MVHRTAWIPHFFICPLGWLLLRVANNRTRVFSYAHVHARHAALLAWPHPLCVDWAGASVPLVTEWGDARNAWSAALYAALACASYHVCANLPPDTDDENENDDDDDDGNVTE